MEAVTFKDLACVVVDEQHRFGVHQRLALSDKGNKPDILVMTATPIPRTLVLTAYGDMEYSKIDQPPKGRKPVDTRVLPISKLQDVAAALKRKIEQGCRAYWVCPLVEESEKVDLANSRFWLQRQLLKSASMSLKPRLWSLNTPSVSDWRSCTSCGAASNAAFRPRPAFCFTPTR